MKRPKKSRSTKAKVRRHPHANLELHAREHTKGLPAKVRQRKHEEELHRLNRTLRALRDSNQAMIRATSERDYLNEVCRIIVEDCGHRLVWIGFADQNKEKTVRPVAHAGFDEGYLQALNITWADAERGRGPTGIAIRTGKPSVCRNMLTDLRFKPWHDEAKKRGYASSIALPLMADGMAFGAITIYSRRPDPFSEDEIELIRQLAGDLAYGIGAIRLRAERIAAEKSLFLEAFFEHSLDSLVFLDKDFNYLRVNEAYARARQRKVKDFIGRNHFELYPDPEHQAILKNAVRTKTPYRVTAKPFVFPEHAEWGVTHWDWTLVPVLGEQGEVDFLVLSLRDVTLHKRMERALQENEARYRSLVTATAQIVWTTNPQGEVVEELPTWQGFTGQTPREYKGSGWANAVHPEDRERTTAVWSRAVASRSLYQCEYRLRHQDGEYRHVSVRGVPVLDETGKIREWIGTCTDVSERKEAERRRDFTNALLGLFAQKATSKEYLDSVVEVVRQWSGCEALGIRILTQDRDIPYESWAGFEPGFVELERCLSLQRDHCCCPRAVTQAFEDQDRPLLTSGGSYRCDNSLAFLKQLTPEQRARYRGTCMNFGFASLAVIPIRYHNEVIGAIHMADRRPGRFSLGAVEFIESMTPLIGEAVNRFRAEAELAKYRDHLEELVRQRTGELEAANARLQIEIAERKRAQETLQQTAQDLERSNRDLEQFAYVASHDLQEPLRAVGGYVRLLQRRFPEKVDAKALEYIAGAADGASRMERLITDLLSFSRVGTRGGAFAPADLNALLATALQNLQASIKAAHATVTSDPLPSLTVDATQIVQLFQNLIGNAVKFQSQRPPEIRVGARRQEGRWVISVRDNGIGIEPQYFERIFQIFQRLHTRKHYPGTGIGLAICKRIVERHGGAIWVESQPEQGSTFYFSIPDNSETKNPAI